MKERFQEAIRKLREQKREIEAKIEALLVAERVLAHPPSEKPRRTLDKQATAKTVEFLKKRRGPTTSKQLAKAFKITVEAANQRLISTHKKGLITRVKKGAYTVREAGGS